jgi:nucleoside-diphosphate-sugar epimerase
MKVLLTGATGFIGSFLLKKLVAEGHEVVILARLKSQFYRIEDVINNITIIYTDYFNLNECETEIMDFNPEVVYHIGWLGVENTMHNDESLLFKNIQSTLSLVKVIIKCNVKVVVALGSQAEYGPYRCFINETQSANPTSLYGIAKLSAYNIFRYYLNANNIRLVWLRLFSSYGPSDNPNWLIPYLIRTIAEGKSPALTKGEQIWDYLYIDDVVSAIMACVNTKNASGLFNLGSGIGYSLKSIITQIRDIIDPNISLGFGEVEYRTDQVMVLQADNTKLRLETNWFPHVQLDEGLRITINWFLNNLK